MVWEPLVILGASTPLIKVWLCFGPLGTVMNFKIYIIIWLRSISWEHLCSAGHGSGSATIWFIMRSLQWLKMATSNKKKSKSLAGWKTSCMKIQSIEELLMSIWRKVVLKWPAKTSLNDWKRPNWFNMSWCTATANTKWIAFTFEKWSKLTLKKNWKPE